MGHWSIKKPLGSKASVVQQAFTHPLPVLIGGPLGLAYNSIGHTQDVAKTEAQQRIDRANSAQQSAQDQLAQSAIDEQTKREALAKQQQGQINDFATQQQGAVADYRKTLAQNLSDTAQQTFSQANPGLLEDLNSRGLFTSQTARDDSQNRALSALATQQQSALSNFDTSEFNNINDIKGAGLSTLLGGDQSALDSALQIKQAGIQQSFAQAQQQQQQAFAQMLAAQQQRQQMISSILGLGGTLGGALIGGPAGASIGGSLGSMAGSSMFSPNPSLNLYQPNQLGGYPSSYGGF